nr:hypothetical protein [Mycoplasmopsis bovis]
MNIPRYSISGLSPSALLDLNVLIICNVKGNEVQTVAQTVNIVSKTESGLRLSLNFSFSINHKESNCKHLDK